RTYFGADFARVAQSVVTRSALKRIPELDEIAAATLLLCTPEADFITAQTIMVDGGLTLASPVAA
ncbi:MAG: SDR family oxidoreductase, partial [Candidatus Binataceae bacterium]